MRKEFENTLSVNELEFLAQNELVQIFPSATFGTLHLISVCLPIGSSVMLIFSRQDDYGPLRTNQVASVPLWVARQLRKSHLCRIVVPIWMGVEWLMDKLAGETNNRDDFQALPFYYLEIATIILEWYHHLLVHTYLSLGSAAEDVPRSEEVRVLLQQLREQRNAKIYSGLPLIDGNPLKVSLIMISHHLVNSSTIWVILN